MPRLTLRCNRCGVALLVLDNNTHWEDVRLLALQEGWELDSNYGDLCDTCAVSPELVLDLREELNLPPMGRLIMIGHPGQPSWLDVARVVAVTAVLQLARSRG